MSDDVLSKRASRRGLMRVLRANQPKPKPGLGTVTYDRLADPSTIARLNSILLEGLEAFQKGIENVQKETKGKAVAGASR